MHFCEESLDDLLREVFEHFLKNKYPLIEATKGRSYEAFGVLLELRNPRARLSRSELKGTPYSCIGELCWYLSGSNKLADISYYIKSYSKYSDDGETIHGAYGPRLTGANGEIDQLDSVVKLLKKKPTSRRAVIQLFRDSDLEMHYNDIPCTTNIQFLVREDSLDMMVNMRSNDIYRGLPHDIFCFTMIQEIIACQLNLKLGVYKHSVGSLHLYEDMVENAAKYVNEGWHAQIPMPSMNKESIELNVKTFLELEKAVRTNCDFDANRANTLDSYWQDILILLKAFNAKKSSDIETLKILKSSLTSDIYKVYIDKAIDRIN